MKKIKFYSKPGQLAFTLITETNDPGKVISKYKELGFKGFAVVEEFQFKFTL